MVTEVRIYCEGGGDGRAKELFREGLNSFLAKLKNEARVRKIRWTLIACGSKHQTYKDFRLALRTHSTAFNVLLVDSDGPKTIEQNPWLYLGKDPNGQNERHCHLMVQLMETWLIADVDTLQRYYGSEFKRSVVPADANVERIEKSRLVQALNSATSKTQKGKYHKIQHAPDILKILDTEKVCSAAPHCRRLFQTLSAIIAG